MNWIQAFVGMTALPLVAFAYISPGAPAGFVNDFANILAADQRVALEAKLQNFEKTSSNEIVIAIITSLGGDTVENFAEKLFQEWGIGKPRRKVGVPTGASGQDNGVLLLVSKEDRKIRIEVGYGLEGALTDAQSFAIIDKILKPAFRANDFYGGLNAAVDAMIGATRGEYAVNVDAKRLNGEEMRFLVYIGALLFMWVASMLARSKSWWFGGVIGGFAGVAIGFIYGFVVVGFVALAALIPLGLLVDFFVSRTYHRAQESGGRIPWWIGGGHGGGFGGGGFGGFGGGRSGGGGSSGGW